MYNFQGKALKYGDNINTDIISPPAYMELPLDEMSQHAMAPIDSDFVKLEPGDVFVAENNLGSGSSRETAPLTLYHLGIRVILAKSYARIFYRNCINLGIMALQCPDTEKIDYNDKLSVDPVNGTVYNETKDETYSCDKLPEHLIKIINAGGLIKSLKQRFN